MARLDHAGQEAVLDYVRTHREELEAAYAGAHDGDEEAVHDMRVASRRLRSSLRTFRGLWDRPAVDAARAELKWLADRLGAVRDAQVMAARLDAALRDEPPELVFGPVGRHVRQRFGRDVADGLERLRRSLTSARYRRLISMLAAFAASPTRQRGPAWVAKRARRDLRRADARLDAALAADGDSGGSSDQDERLHDARKAFKRGRYAVEVLRNAARRPHARRPHARRARRLVKRLKDLQDLLGAYQDSIITRQVLRDLALREFREGGNTFTYGVLHARQASGGARSLAQVAKASRRARRTKVRRWL